MQPLSEPQLPPRPMAGLPCGKVILGPQATSVEVDAPAPNSTTLRFTY